jgi:hypothetical protein
MGNTVRLAATGACEGDGLAAGTLALAKLKAVADKLAKTSSRRNPLVPGCFNLRFDILKIPPLSPFLQR